MFRNVARLLLAALGVAALAAGVWSLARHEQGWRLAVTGLVLLFGAAVERWRYKPLERTAGPGFQPTAERFRDPASGAAVRVYADPRTGERRYVRDDARP